MGEKFTLSVIVPVYNAQKFIRQTIDSVLSQTYSEFELILVDDCSTDNSYDILCEYIEKDSRVKVYKNEKNMGVSYTRNFAVDKAQGEFVALIDSDDMWEQNKLKIQMQAISDNNADLCYTGSAFVDTHGVRSNFVFKVPQTITYKKLLKQNIMSCSSVVVRKELLKKYPMAHDNMHEDFATWLAIAKSGAKCIGVNQPLLIYRVNRNSKSGNKVKSMEMTYRVYKFIGLNIFQRVYYMISYIITGIKKHSSI